MYKQFYGFSDKPFNVTPDPKFLYLSPSHQEALASMLYGIRERKGFVFMIPKRGRVGAMFRPVYEMMASLAATEKKGKRS